MFAGALCRPVTPQAADDGDADTGKELSPVLGAVVVLGLTIALTVAVGLVGSGGGGSGADVPETEFDIDERIVHLTDETGSARLIQVRIAVVSGERVAVPTTDITVEGDDTAVGLVEIQPDSGDVVAPMPDVRRAYRAGEPVPVEPGHTWNVVAYDWLPDEEVTTQSKVLHYRESEDGTRPNRSAARAANEAEDTDGDDRLGLMPLFPGDEVRVVWEAASGPERETLVRYTVEGNATDTPQ
jgi:hypothetical protein